MNVVEQRKVVIGQADQRRKQRRAVGQHRAGPAGDEGGCGRLRQRAHHGDVSHKRLPYTKLEAPHAQPSLDPDFLE